MPVEYCPKLTIDALAEQGFLPGLWRHATMFVEVKGRLSLTLRYDDPDPCVLTVLSKLRPDLQLKLHELRLKPTISHRAGRSHLFVCPGLHIQGQEKRCGRRVYALYFPDTPTVEAFACRQCLGMTYRSRVERRPATRPYRRRPKALPPPSQAGMAGAPGHATAELSS